VLVDIINEEREDVGDPQVSTDEAIVTPNGKEKKVLKETDGTK